MDNSNDQSNEHIKEMLDIIKEENPPDTEKTQPGKVLSQKEKLMKLMMMIKVSTMIKIIKEDNTPIELIDGLFIGSFASSLNKKALLENGITHIVVCGTGLKQNYPNEFKYVQFNLLDSENEDIKKYFIEVGIFIDSAFKNGGKVLVHCHAGISRSSTIVLSYLIKYKQMKLDAALELIRSKREKINPNPGFINQLKEYEKQVFQ